MMECHIDMIRSLDLTPQTNKSNNFKQRLTWSDLLCLIYCWKKGVRRETKQEAHLGGHYIVGMMIAWMGVVVGHGEEKGMDPG